MTTKIGSYTEDYSGLGIKCAELQLQKGTNSCIGTFTANGTSSVTVANTSVNITDAIIISLNTVGGTVGAIPTIQTITAGTGFTTKAASSDTSIYNYAIIRQS